VTTRRLIAIMAGLLVTAGPAVGQTSSDAFVTATDAPDPVDPGGQITYTITVSAGEGTVTEVKLENPVPAQTTPVSATTSSPETCEPVAPSTTVFRCDLGTIAAGAAKTVTIVVRTNESASGTVASVATITAKEDTSPSNNSASSVTTVNEPPVDEPISEDPPPAPGPQPPPTPPAPDEAPPGPVSRLRATVGNRLVVMRWVPPSDPDYARVVITRSTANSADRVVYEGSGQEFADRGLRNGTLYMYEFRTVDRTGNSSDGVWVAATPRGARLFSPRANARLSSPPALRWITVRGATYYNVQLYRGSRKILSAWPRGNHIKLQASWRFAGRRERLQPGAYHWFVWPGRGPRSASKYGPLIGRSSFVIVAPH
jgi:uncharacterized repeat protein (TIGR01451 family)